MKVLTLLLGVSLCGSASVIFSENFSGGTPDPGGAPYGVGSLPGTQFHVTAGTVDIVGVLNGTYFSCVDNPAGNCLDLLGSFGELGQITSTPTFNLVAGATYTLTYGVIVQGVSSGTESYSVSLGGLSQTLTATPSVQDMSVSFTPVSSQSGATLVFSQLSSLNAVNGAIIDNIVLSASGPPTGVPEPSSLAMMSAFIVAGPIFHKVRRRRKPARI